MEWSVPYIVDLMEKLGYPDSTKYKVYWLLPGQRIVDGLFFVCDDGDLQKLISTVPKDSNVVLFLDQMYVIDNSIWDDVLIESNAPELPSVIMSPCKSAEQFSGQAEEDITAKMNEKLDRLHKLKNLKEDDSDSDRLDSDPDFFDNDNDPLDGDDDMFAAFVDQDVRYSMIPDKGKEEVQGNEVEKDKDKKNKRKREDSDGELELPDSEDENFKFKFKSFVAIGMEEPEFKVEMFFSTVEQLREAIDQYSSPREREKFKTWQIVPLALWV
ncbi:uncharacterized protein LOC123407039 isoform X1 [Hordeum vulgare subsp. vulgare]|uniref:uncharacterized protein LOC123407039 isoform X1 n=2 Tax=Hordeum vulgare subsp. vulgare TaxID=112509 RepID=UPI000B4790B7|nr:uncharacterized protein LOC123407039 isoform X1 [Hordeum vulgare subsp. vulgare]